MHRTFAFALLTLFCVFNAGAAQPVRRFERKGDAGLPERRSAVQAVSLADHERIKSLPVLWQGPVAGGSVLIVRGWIETFTEPEFHDRESEVRLAFEEKRGKKSRRFYVPIEPLTGDCHDEDDPQLAVSPFGIGPLAEGVLVSYSENTCGMHGSVATEHLIAIVPADEPRLLEFSFDDVELWGYANGGAIRSYESTACSWTGQDFDCTQERLKYGDWSISSASRRFLAFEAQPRRFESSHSLRAASLEELPDIVRRRNAPGPVLVDAVGMLFPVTTMARSGRRFDVYASVDRDDEATATFYLVGTGTVIKATPAGFGPWRALVDYDPPGEVVEWEKKEAAVPWTRTSIDADFRTVPLKARPKLELMQTVLDLHDDPSLCTERYLHEGAPSPNARALFWIAVDLSEPKPRLAALRLGSTGGEGSDRGKVVPATLMRYEFSGDDAAFVELASSWIDDVFEGPRCTDLDAGEEPPDHLLGVVTWFDGNFDFALTPRPFLTDRVAVRIFLDGRLAAQPIVPLNE